MHSDPSFLTTSRLSTRERDALREIEERRMRIARRSYRAATFLLVLAMAVIAAPQLNLAAWNWHMVIGVAVVMTGLGTVMFLKGSITNGVLTLICAWGILPGWIWMAPRAVGVGKDLYHMIATQWSERT